MAILRKRFKPSISHRLVLRDIGEAPMIMYLAVSYILSRNIGYLESDNNTSLIHMNLGHVQPFATYWSGRTSTTASILNWRNLIP
jgi:hypothetical protein